ncbi:MAG: alpha/beta hydrolase [Halieaceae bacterium]
MSSPAAEVESLLQHARQVSTPLPQGGNLCWQCWGREDEDTLPLVLLHGGFGSWTHWFANLPVLAETRQVWTVDLPGLGSSGDMPAPFTTEHFAELLLAGIDQVLGPDAMFDLAGFSFGAMIGGHVAAGASERCSRFVMIGAAGFGDLHVQVSLLPPPGPDTEAGEADAIQRENLGRLMLASPAVIDDMAVYLHGDNLARHRFRSRKLAGSADLVAALPNIHADLVGVWGCEDATAGGRKAIEQRRELLQQVQPGAEFHILEGVGHWAMYEAPESINRILLAD